MEHGQDEDGDRHGPHGWLVGRQRPFFSSCVSPRQPTAIERAVPLAVFTVFTISHLITFRRLLPRGFHNVAQTSECLLDIFHVHAVRVQIDAVVSRLREETSAIK